MTLFFLHIIARLFQGSCISCTHSASDLTIHGCSIWYKHKKGCLGAQDTFQPFLTVNTGNILPYSHSKRVATTVDKRFGWSCGSCKLQIAPSLWIWLQQPCKTVSENYIWCWCVHTSQHFSIKVLSLHHLTYLIVSCLDLYWSTLQGAWETIFWFLFISSK